MLYHKTYRHASSQEWVTFVHGAGGSSSIWYKQLREYCKEFNVLLLDLRGHGNSFKGSPKMKNYTFKQVTQEILDVLDHLKIEKSHFVGISLGTILIRELAEIRPSAIKSMVLGGAIVKFNFRGRFLMKIGNVFKSVLPYMFLYKLFAFAIMPRKAHTESRNLFINEAKKVVQHEFLRWFKLTSSVNKLLKFHRTKDVKIPTLYLMGSEDYMFLEPIKEVVEKHMRSMLEVIPDCGHVVNVDRPAVFNKLSIRFLKSQSVS